MNKYNDVTVRFLQDNERLILSNEPTLPLVIESKSFSDTSHLHDFLSTHSNELLNDISNYGAVLLRGFKIKSTTEFEKTILSIHGMVGMGHFFMSEPGRILVDNLNYIYHTNQLIKTGGTLNLGGFHSENYYSPDVPRYISFFCLNPSKRGGETGLINMSHVYNKLSSSLQEKLEKNALFVAKWPLANIAQRYQINQTHAADTGVHFGLSLTDDNCLTMHKPSVIKHPVTKQTSIHANLCAELPGLNDRLMSYFMHDYKGLQWMLHKAAWKFLGYQKIRELSFMLPRFFRNPILFLKNRSKMKQKTQQFSANKAARIGNLFKPEDIDILAKLMREHYASFLWQPGDILLVDNLHIAHAGMPGQGGPRNIRAMLCNPMEVPYASSAPGLFEPRERGSKTLGALLMETASTIAS